MVINCAAWTAVDRAEQEPDACFLANAKAVGWLADACRSVGALLVQISTDYVFGTERERRTPYREDDATGPLSTYGKSKLAGEEAARSHGDHLIVRTCGLYSAGDNGAVRGRNFLDTMLVLAESRAEVSVVHDQHCTPSYVPHVATGILSLVALDQRGTFHVTNSGETTWHAIAETLFACSGKPVTVRPISSGEYVTAVERPAYSVLDTAKFEGVTKNELPHWKQAVAAYVGRMLERIPCNQSL